MPKFMDVYRSMKGITAAPSVDAVRRIDERTGHPADDVYPLPIEV